MAGVSTGADFIFIPESPPDQDWEGQMCEIISKVKLKTVFVMLAADRTLAPKAGKAEKYRHRRRRRTRSRPQQDITNQSQRSFV